MGDVWTLSACTVIFRHKEMREEAEIVNPYRVKKRLCFRTGNPTLLSPQIRLIRLERTHSPRTLQMAHFLNGPIFFATGVGAVLTYLLLRPRRRQSPPGPPGWPVIGNMLDLPKKESWKVYLDWGKQYSSYDGSLRS